MESLIYMTKCNIFIIFTIFSLLSLSKKCPFRVEISIIWTKVFLDLLKKTLKGHCVPYEKGFNYANKKEIIRYRS